MLKMTGDSSLCRAHLKLRLALLWAVGAIGALGISSTAIANQLRLMPLPELVSSSDVVLLGQVVSQGTWPSGSERGFQYVTVKVDRMIIGRTPNSISVVTLGGDPEGDAGHLVAGREYLFFLEKYKDAELYGATNGPTSIAEALGN
jgi:hypothetical protein